MLFDMRGKLFVACLGLFLSGSWVLGADPTPTEGGSEVSSVVAPPSVRPANYALSPGDSIVITVFREPDLNTQQRLSRDGTINFPLLGVIRLSAKNTNEAAALIANLLSKGYLIHPQVTVSVVDYAKIKFTILGQVSNPGAFEISGDQNIDILAAIARAGGFTRLANPANVIVRRTVNGQEETYKLDVKRLMNDKKSQRFPIQPNDTISVGERIF